MNYLVNWVITAWIWLGQNNPQISVLIAAGGVAVVVAGAIKASSDLRERAQPVVVVDLRMDSRDPRTAMLVVENNGQTSAKNLKVDFLGLFTEANLAEDASLPSIKNRYEQVIPLLAPGQSLKNIWQHSDDNFQRKNTYQVKVTYKGLGWRLRKENLRIDMNVINYASWTERKTASEKDRERLVKEGLTAVRLFTGFLKRSQPTTAFNKQNLGATTQVPAIPTEPKRQKRRRIRFR